MDIIFFFEIRPAYQNRNLCLFKFLAFKKYNQKEEKTVINLEHTKAFCLVDFKIGSKPYKNLLQQMNYKDIYQIPFRKKKVFLIGDTKQ